MSSGDIQLTSCEHAGVRADHPPTGVTTSIAATILIGAALAATGAFAQMPPAPDFDPQADLWRAGIEAGGDVWVKEGGQSDLTAAIVRRLSSTEPELAVRDRVHVIQHSNWNEEQTTPAALEYVKETVDYIRIPDANAFLNIAGGNAEFEAAARAHPVFGPIWDAAFAYYNPGERLDFSDTGELLFLLGLGQMPIDEFTP